MIFSAGLLAPAGTPAEIVARLNVELNEAMKTPELAASMRKLGFEPTIWSPQAYAAFLVEETAPLAGDREGFGREGGVKERIASSE